jgi:hypothetical protein
MCALFLGSEVVPTKDNIKNLHPIMVTKTIVHTLIEFLMDCNPWYSSDVIEYSPKNVNDLYDKTDADEDERAIPSTVDLCQLVNNGSTQGSAINTGGYADREVVFADGEGQQIAMEAMGYTTGDYSPRNYRIMKATALAWCLDGHKTINSTTGSQLMADYDPGLMSFLFPWLDPWGIGDFCDTRRRPDQYISFDRQV